jgi:hypothetical protein
MGCAGHAFDSAGDEQLSFAGPNRVRGRGYSLEPGPAEPVHCLTRYLYRQAGEQQRHAGYVPVVFACLIGAAQNDIVNVVERKEASLDQGPNGCGCQVIRADIRQRAAGAPYWGTHGGGDEGVRHGPAQNE